MDRAVKARVRALIKTETATKDPGLPIKAIGLGPNPWAKVRADPRAAAPRQESKASTRANIKASTRTRGRRPGSRAKAANRVKADVLPARVKARAGTIRIDIRRFRGLHSSRSPAVRERL